MNLTQNKYAHKTNHPARSIGEESYQPDEANRTPGRPPVSLSFTDEADFFVGLNLGVRHTQIGSATMAGEIPAEEEFETPEINQKICAPGDFYKKY